MKELKKDQVIDSVAEDRRGFLRKAATAAYVAPAVATFTMTGLMSRPAAAQTTNMGTS